MSLSTGGYISQLGSGAAAGAAAGGPWGAVIGAGGALASGLLSNKGSNRASDLQYRASQEALQFAREQEAAKREYQARQDAALKAQWDAEQARLAPYRAASAALLGSQGRRLGLNLGTIASPAIPSTPPPGWVPGAPLTSSSYGSTGARSLSSLAGMNGQNAYDTTTISPQKLTLRDIGFQFGQSSPNTFANSIYGAGA